MGARRDALEQECTGGVRDDMLRMTARLRPFDRQERAGCRLPIQTANRSGERPASSHDHFGVVRLAEFEVEG